MNSIEALKETIDEMQVTCSPDNVAKIIELCLFMRTEIILSHLNAQVIKNDLWSKLRNDRMLLTHIFSLTNTFYCLLNDNEFELKLSNSLVTVEPFSDLTVDKDFIEYFGDRNEYQNLLTNNKWLAFLIHLTLNLRLLLGSVNPKLIPTPEI